MKISVIQAVYYNTPLIPITLVKNLTALFESGVDFQYILYNDNGEKDIITDVLFYLDKIRLKNPEKYKKYRNAFEYIYSDVNLGQLKVSGALIGAIPYIKGELIHQIGQDDIFSKDFFIECVEKLKNSELYFYTANAYKVNSDLKIMSIATNPFYEPDCSKPLKVFADWYGINPPDYIVTRINNGFLAPGTVYKKQLHDLIGTFDLQYFGATDFEYWSRMLFYEYKGFYQSKPMWFYTLSEYSISLTKDKYEDIMPDIFNKIKNKYAELVEKYKYKFVGKI